MDGGALPAAIVSPYLVSAPEYIAELNAEYLAEKHRWLSTYPG